MLVRLGSVSIVLALVFAAGCGAQQLPPPPAPSREVPPLDLPDGPPAAGNGRVIVDANGDRARVVEVTGTMTGYAGRYVASFAAVRPLCTTPCVVDLPYGSHPLVLQSTTDESRQSTAELDVGPRPKVFRHALGERTNGGAARAAGMGILGLGFLAAITGVSMWGVGAMEASATHKPSSLESSGRVVTLIGGGAMLLSLPLLYLGRPTERAGATTEWTLPHPTPPTPDGLGPGLPSGI